MTKSLLTYCFMAVSMIAVCNPYKGDTWQDILENGGGEIKVFWYPNNEDITISKDVVDGIEHDLMDAFEAYLEAKYNVAIEVTWVGTADFQEVMDATAVGEGGVFGASSISITKERSARMDFTPPFLPDVAVLVSNTTLPLAQTDEEFKKLLSTATIFSIKGTTHEKSLLDLQLEYDLEYEIQYLNNSGQIMDVVASTPDALAYVGLPNFLNSFKDSENVRRQFFRPLKQNGLAFSYPKGSDWADPVTDYFGSAQYQRDNERIIVKYLGPNARAIINRIGRSAVYGPLEEIALSNQEKELQYQELLEVARRERMQARNNSLYLVAVILITSAAFVLVYVNRQGRQTNRLLKTQYDKIEQNNVMLKSINQEKNDLIKILAHDLRSPLANILGISMLFKDNPNFNEDDLQMNEYILQASRKIELMITKILDVDAIESGELNMKLQPVPVEEVITQVIRDNKQAAGRKSITLKQEVSSELIAIADRFYLTQVIDNLVSNALKFNHPESTVWIRVSQKEDQVDIAVEDQGPGLTEDDQKKLFQKFQKLSARPTGGEASIGLGLSIVKLYVEKMHGQVIYHTTLGKGTTFHVILPLQAAEASAIV